MIRITKIFYGAGGTATQNLSRWIDNIGEPTCFVDIDNNKHGKTITANLSSNKREVRYNIYSLTEAISKYPDYVLYISISPDSGTLLSVTEYLLGQGIPKERIRYCEDVVYRRGCSLLGQFILATPEGISPCCTPYGKLISYSEKIHDEQDLRAVIYEYNSWLRKTLEMMHSDAPTDCDACSMLEWNYWPKDPKVNHLTGQSFANAVCNCRCIYCNQFSDTAFVKCEHDLDLYDIYKIFADEFGNSIKAVTLADGEITVLPHREKLFRLIEDQNWGVNIATNALIYSVNVAEILSRQPSLLSVSLDAGTAETFNRVKGLNAFYQVVTNIEKYAETKCRIDLKYILIPEINDSFADINGFIAIALKYKAHVALSHDLNNYTKSNRPNRPPTNITEQQFATYAYFVARCKEVGLPVYYSVYQFLSEDCYRMNNLCHRY